MSKVTTHSIIEGLEVIIEDVKKDKRLDIEKRARLITMLVGRQIQAGSLSLQFQKNVGRIPEEASRHPQLLSSDTSEK